MNTTRLVVIDSLPVILSSSSHSRHAQSDSLRPAEGSTSPSDLWKSVAGISVLSQAVGNYHDNKLGGFWGGLWPGAKCVQASRLLTDPKKPNLQWQDPSVTGFL